MPSTSLIIIGESLDPATITRLLKLKPSRQWRKGDRKSFQRRDGSVHYFDSIHKWGGWKLWSTEAQRKKEMDKQIERWLVLLTKKKKELAQIRRSDSEIFLDCCIVGEADSICLSPEILTQMAQLGLTFQATYYSSSEDGPNQSAQTRSLARPV